MRCVLLTVILLTVALPLALATDQTTKPAAVEKPESDQRVRSLRVVVLSTMLAEGKIGEWGFAAFVEADGHRILFDTGARPDTVLKNARDLNIDLAGVREVILSHNHRDHTGGLLNLRRELAKANPAALSRAHVGNGIFWSRPRKQTNVEGNAMIALRPDYQATGGVFIEHKECVELYPGVFLTGPVPRTHPEQKGGGWGLVKTPVGDLEDNIPEEISLVLDTEKGLVVISGCGHSGIINTLEFARNRIRRTPIYAAIGGFHLTDHDAAKITWTATRLREFGLQHFLGAHCTGMEALYRLRQDIGLNSETCVVGMVGSSFRLDQGIDFLTKQNIAR